MRAIEAQPALEEYVTTVQKLRSLELDSPELVFVYGEDSTDLLGKAVPYLLRLADHGVLFSKYYHGCGDDNCVHCSQNSIEKSILILNDLNDLITKALVRGSDLIVIPFAETVFPKQADRRISAAVADFLIQIDKLKAAAKPLKIVLLTNSPWLIDDRLLDSRRVDEMLAVLKTTWVETAEDKTLRGRLTNAAVGLLVDGFIKLLGQSTGGSADIVHRLIANRCPEEIVVKAMVGLRGFMKPADANALLKNMSADQVNKFHLLVKEKKRYDRSGTAAEASPLSTDLVLDRISQGLGVEDVAWLNCYFELATIEPSKKYEKQLELERLAADLPLLIHPETEAGVVLMNFLNSWLRGYVLSTGEEVVFLNFIRSRKWRNVLTFLMHVRVFTDRMIDELLRQEADATVLRMLWLCFSRTEERQLERLLEIEQGPDMVMARNARIAIAEIVPFTLEQLDGLLRKTQRSIADTRARLQLWSEHVDVFKHNGQNRLVINQLHERYSHERN